MDSFYASSFSHYHRLLKGLCSGGSPGVRFGAQKILTVACYSCRSYEDHRKCHWRRLVNDLSIYEFSCGNSIRIFRRVPVDQRYRTAKYSCKVWWQQSLPSRDMHQSIHDATRGAANFHTASICRQLRWSLMRLRHLEEFRSSRRAFYVHTYPSIYQHHYSKLCQPNQLANEIGEYSTSGSPPIVILPFSGRSHWRFKHFRHLSLTPKNGKRLWPVSLQRRRSIFRKKISRNMSECSISTHSNICLPKLLL